MAHMQYLVFNNENIPMPASYSVNLSDVEADSGGVTEAGTTQRDVVREGVVQIGVTFRVSGEAGFGYIVWIALEGVLHIERVLIANYIVKKMSLRGIMVSL